MSPKKRLAPPPVHRNTPYEHIVLNYPSISAVAVYEQKFPSGKTAVAAGQRVTLEFTPTMVVVHDPASKSEVESNKLGRILWSHNFATWELDKYSPQIARETGVVSADMAYALLEVRKVKKTQCETSQCAFCGREFKKVLSAKAAEDHLTEHQAS